MFSRLKTKDKFGKEGLDNKCSLLLSAVAYMNAPAFGKTVSSFFPSLRTLWTKAYRAL